MSAAHCFGAGHVNPATEHVFTVVPSGKTQLQVPTGSVNRTQNMLAHQNITQELPSSDDSPCDNLYCKSLQRITSGFTHISLTRTSCASVVVLEIGVGLFKGLGLVSDVFSLSLGLGRLEVFDQDQLRFSQHCNDTTIAEKNPAAALF